MQLLTFDDKQLEALEIKDQSVQECFHKSPSLFFYHSLCLTQHSFFTNRLDTLYMKSLWLCHYNRKSRHLVVLAKKGLSVES